MSLSSTELGPPPRWRMVPTKIYIYIYIYMVPTKI